jgi:soluble lytic murein transglycosylase
MENLQVYRVRFDTGARVMSKLDQHRETTQEASSVPLSSMRPSLAEW